MFRRLAQGAVAAGALALFAFAWRCDEPWFDRHVFLPQQFFISASRGIVFWSRAAAAGSGVLLLLLVLFMPRGAAARRLLAAVLLALPAAEALVQWRLRRLTASIDRLQLLSGREIGFQTDAEGRRISGAPVDPSLPSLVFTGESTVAGMGLRWEETFPAILGARLHFQVVNLGSPAYRVDQSWLRLKDALPELRHPVAVIGIFMPGLVGRSFAGQRHPLGRPSPSGGIEVVPPEAPGLLQRSGLYRLWRHLYWSDAAVDEGMRSVSSALREMAALAKARGAPCIFLVTGRTPQWMLHDLFDAPGLDYVVAQVPEEALLADGHPAPRGSLGIADALEPRLRTRIANR